MLARNLLNASLMDIRFHLKRLSMRYALEVAGRKLPRPLAFLSQDLLQAVRGYDVLPASMPRAQRIRQAVRLAAAPRKTLLFYPELPQPARSHKALLLCAVNGYKMVSDPSRRYDVGFKFHDRTFTPPEALEGLAGERPVINRWSTDISKRRVQEVFQETFGYALGLDPTTHRGPAVRKSDQNAKHDGAVVECPVHPEDVESGAVYERYIDTATPEGLLTNIRVGVCGGLVPVALVMYRPAGSLFKGLSRYQVTPLADVFTAEERVGLERFARNFGLDYGEMDVLRDNADGRIYVVDANNTPSSYAEGEHPTQHASEKVTWYRALQEAFAEMVNAFERGGAPAEPPESCTAVPPVLQPA